MADAVPWIAPWIGRALRIDNNRMKPVYFCGYCGKEYYMLQNLINHVATKHQDKAE